MISSEEIAVKRKSLNIKLKDVAKAFGYHDNNCQHAYITERKLINTDNLRIKELKVFDNLYGILINPDNFDISFKESFKGKMEDGNISNSKKEILTIADINNEINK